MIPEINKLKTLYQQLDRQQAAGEDVVAELKKEINNIELAYLKEQVFPQVAQFMASKVRDLRCGIDSSFQFDGEHSISYSFCTSGSMLLIKDSLSISSNDVHDAEPSNNGSVQEKTMSQELWIKMILSMSNKKDNGKVSRLNALYILSIIELIKQGIIKENRIYASSSLDETYQKLWRKYFASFPSYSETVYHPYVNLNNEPFYYLAKPKAFSQFIIKQGWNRTLVNRYIKYAYFDEELFSLLQQESFTNVLAEKLIDKYLSNYTNYSVSTISTTVTKRELNFDFKQDKFSEFKKYLSSLQKKDGKKYTESSIEVYASSLRSKYLKGILDKIAGISDINLISDLETLDRIIEKVEYETNQKKAIRIYFLALKMFREYRILNPISPKTL